MISTFPHYHHMMLESLIYSSKIALPYEDSECSAQKESIFSSCKSCHFSHDNDSPAADNLIPGGHDHNSVLKDLTFHEWPDIDNFEDVERMFR